MEKDIYDLLNHVDTDFEEYEKIELSEYENKVNSKRILSKMKGGQVKNSMKSWGLMKKIGVASVIAVIGLASATTAAFASEGRFFNYLYTFFNGSKVISEYNKWTGIGKTSVEIRVLENPPVRLEDGRLKFIVNDKEIDITNKISDTVPYIDGYVDEQNVTHKFIIGGRPIEEGYGYEENLFGSDGKFIAASGYYGSEVIGIENSDELEWLVTGREIIGRNGQ